MSTNMTTAIRVIKQLRHQLANWVEIADDEDQRDEDYEALRAADRFLLDAGVSEEELE